MSRLYGRWDLSRGSEGTSCVSYCSLRSIIIVSIFYETISFSLSITTNLPYAKVRVHVFDETV